MDKYIKQLLEQYSKVILPKFGAIVIENDETGELMFNEYLNYNDGKLDAIIEKESNMELQEAQNMIAKYIRDIQAQIDKGESYDIFGLGSFSKNKDGEVEFSGNIKTGEAKKVESTAGPSPSPTPTKKEEVKKVEPNNKGIEKTDVKDTQKKENKYVAPAPTPSVQESTKKTNDAPKETKTSDSKTEGKLALDKKDKALKEEKLKAKKKAEQDKVKAKEKAKKEKEEAKKAKYKSKEENKKTKSKKAGEPKKKKRRVGVFGWIIIILLFLAAGGSITAGLYYDEISDYMGWNEFTDQKEIAQNDAILTDDSNTKENETSKMTDDQQDAVDETEDDQVNTDSAEPEMVEKEEGNNNAKQVTEEPEEKVEPEPTNNYSSNTNSGSYHLIAGGFREKSNAEDLVNELNGKGLNAQIIGRINGLHFVSAKSYNSLQAAKQDINNVRSQVPGAWVYKK